MDTISKETDIDKIRIYYSQNIQLDHRKDKLNYTQSTKRYNPLNNK